jgi:MFS transporter, DHA1 family, chloramphenicol resistance protein
MGTSEFMLAGLLPAIAADIGVPIGAAGLLTTAFAVGMVAGAPLAAVLARGRPGRPVLAWSLVVFLAAHVAGALTSSPAVLLAGRVVAALANAAFLAVALGTATGMVTRDRRARALAVLLSGSTLATVVGVPGGAVLGALLGWRATFWAVAALCVPALVGVLSGPPAAPPGPAGSVRSELRALLRGRLALVVTLTALVNAGTFGAFTFLAPVLTGPAGLAPLWVPAALALFGLGAFAGVTAAGRLAGHRPRAVLGVAGPLLAAGWVAAAVLADRPVALLMLVPVQGALSFAVGGTLIARVMDEAGGAPTLAGACATAALNVGAAAGPVLAAAALGPVPGAVGPLWVAAALVAAALGLGLPFRRLIGVRRPLM